jgi:serine/threonine protein kinase
MMDPRVMQSQAAVACALQKLRHENLVNMIEVFRRKRRFYLVFEYVDHTILDELEDNSSGLGDETSRQYIFQVLRGIDFCHANNVSCLPHTFSMLRKNFEIL